MFSEYDVENYITSWKCLTQRLISRVGQSDKILVPDRHQNETCRSLDHIPSLQKNHQNPFACYLIFVDF